MEQLEEIKELLGADFYTDSSYVSFYWQESEICYIRQIDVNMWEAYFNDIRVYLDSKQDCLNFIVEDLTKKEEKNE